MRLLLESIMCQHWFSPRNSPFAQSSIGRQTELCIRHNLSTSSADKLLFLSRKRRRAVLRLASARDRSSERFVPPLPMPKQLPGATRSASVLCPLPISPCEMVLNPFTQQRGKIQHQRHAAITQLGCACNADPPRRVTAQTAHQHFLSSFNGVHHNGCVFKGRAAVGKLADKNVWHPRALRLYIRFGQQFSHVSHR